jgi:hypothetical protein
MVKKLEGAFENLARGFLSEHPEVRHEWRQVKSRWAGDRVDLVCGGGAPNEVFASLTDGQIAVGLTSGVHQDFEDFGRGRPDEDVAREAFDYFVKLLRDHGYLERTSTSR